MLDDASRGVPGRSERREGDEQSVGLPFPAFEHVLVLRADNLRGSRLPRHLYPGNRKRRPDGGALWLVDHAKHAGADQVEIHRIDVQQRSGLGSAVARHQQAGFDRPAGRDPCRRERKLKRRRGNVALADAAADGLAEIPRLPQGCALPRGIGNNALLLSGEAKVMDLAQAELARGDGKAIDADAVRRLIEKRVAGLLDGIVHIDAATMSLPAAEAMAPEHIASGAAHGLTGRDDAGLEPSKRGDDFEGRSGRIGPAQNAIFQRVIPVSRQLLPTGEVDLERDLIGVEGGIRSHHQDAPVTASSTTMEATRRPSMRLSAMSCSS